MFLIIFSECNDEFEQLNLNNMINNKNQEENNSENNNEDNYLNDIFGQYSLSKISQNESNSINIMSENEISFCCKTIKSCSNKFNKISIIYGKLITLTDISNILKIKSKKIINNMSFMFDWCSSLISLPDISNLDTSNINDLSFMFSRCSSLKEFPDISNWNTSNVKNMSHLFNACKSLISLPNTTI